MKFLNRFKRKSQADPSGEPGAASVPPTEVPVSATDGIENPKSPSADDISLKLGDFLHRIPAHLLQAGPHDLQKEVRFPINILSERINRGETTVNLAEIYRQLPEIFRSEVREADKQQVLYPWRKVITMIKEARGESGDITAAENLAEKIRQKKPSARPANAPAPSKSAQTPILRGRGKQQASWFSPTTLDKGAEPPTAELSPAGMPEPSAPSVNDKAGAPGSISSSVPASKPTPAQAPATEAVNPLKLVSPDQPLGGASVAPPKPSAPILPFEQKPAAAAASAPATKRAEEAPNVSDLPPELQRRVALMKGDYERQLAELELARKTYAAEVERLQQELAKTADRLDEEVTANSANRNMLQQAVRDREKTQKQIAELQSQMDGLQKDSRLTAVSAERDALLQQKAHLSKQISELSKRGASPAPRNGDNAAASAVLQRQVEEFQRRISLMESAQRDTALELAREKEARAKLEKLLSAAEKLQEQSANYMESAKAEIRKEVEASVKPREIEARKVQKELQEQLAQATDQNRKLTTELENVRTALTNATTGSATTPAPDDFQARAIAQLEADIENYRERLKALLKERDTARAEARDLETRTTFSKDAEAGLSAENDVTSELRRKAEEATAAAKTTTEELAEIRRRFEELSGTHAQVSSELERERSNRPAEREANTARLRDESHSLEQQLSKAVSERDRLAQDYAELAAKSEKERAASDDLLGKLERDHADVVRARETLTQRLSEAERNLQSAREAARGGGDESSATISRLEGELGTARKAADEKHAALAKELEAALHKRDQLAAALDEEQKKTAGNISRLEAELGTARKDLAQADAKHAELVKELEAARQNDRQLSLSFDQERQKASELAQNLEALAQEREKFARERADLESKVATSARTATQLVEQSAAELAEARAQIDALKVSMTQAEERAKDVTRQLAEVRSDQQSAEAKVADLEAGLLISAEQVESLKRQVTTVREDAEASALSAARRHEEQESQTRQEIATLHTERDNLSQQRDELLRRLNRITDEHKRLLDDLTAEPTIVPSPTIVEEAQPANVIEVTIPEVLPPDQGNGIAIPRVRPMAVPPPRISTL